MSLGQKIVVEKDGEVKRKIIAQSSLPGDSKGEAIMITDEKKKRSICWLGEENKVTLMHGYINDVRLWAK